MKTQSSCPPPEVLMTMPSWIKQWLASPIFAGDEERTAQARIMNALGIYFLLALVITATVFVPLFAQHKVASWAVILALAILYGIARRIMFRGRLALAATLVIAPAWVLFAGIAVIAGGIASPVMFAVVAATIAISLFVAPRIGTIFAIVGIVAGLGLAALQQSGIVSPQFFIFSPLSTWFVFALALLFMHGLVTLVVRDLQDALTRERQQNAARERAEATLRASEERYRRIFEQFDNVTLHICSMKRCSPSGQMPMPAAADCRVRHHGG